MKQYPEFWRPSTGHCRKSPRDPEELVYTFDPPYRSFPIKDVARNLHRDMINGLVYLIRARAPDYVKGNVSFGTCSFTPVADRKRDNSDKGCKFEPRLC